MQRKNKILALILLIAISSHCFSQKNDWLAAKFKSADSVLLISHSDTEGFTIVDERTSKVKHTPRLFISGKLNDTLIEERKIIKEKNLDSLIHILTRRPQDSKITRYECFMPHHTVLFFKGGKISYIDICIWCRNFTASDDLTGLLSFESRKWDDFKAFLKKNGFKYKIEVGIQ
jgi:hypothetical protein